MAIMAALAIAQGVASYADGVNKARQEEAYYQQNRINSAQARDMQIQGLQKQAIQYSEQYSQKKQDLAIAALKREGTMTVAQAESGLSGQTEAIKFSQAEADKLKGLDVYNQQVNAIFDNIEMQKLGLNSQMMERIRSVKRGVKPSLGMAVLSTASSAIAGEMQFGKQADTYVGNIFGAGGDNLGSKTTAFPKPSSSYTSYEPQ